MDCRSVDTSYTSVIMKQAFEFIAGSDALCLADTLGRRSGETVERLETPGDLVAWLGAAGLLVPGARATRADLIEARTLREAIHRCGTSTMVGTGLPPADIRLLNQAASRPPLRPRMRAGNLTLVADKPIEAAFSTLAADALTLLGSKLHHRIRMCPGCRMMFVDTSRPGLRQWCSSSSGCGNRAKLKSRRARQADSQSISRGTGP